MVKKKEANAKPQKLEKEKPAVVEKELSDEELDAVAAGGDPGEDTQGDDV